MRARRPVTARGLAWRIRSAFVFAITALLLLGLIALRSVERLAEDISAVEHAQRVSTTIAEVFAVAADAESAQRGFTITGDEAFARPYLPAVERSGRVLDRLRELVRDARQRERVAALEGLVAERLAFAARVLDLRRTTGFDAAVEAMLTRRGLELQEEIRALVGELERSQAAILVDRLARAQRTRRWTLAVVGTGAVVTVLLLAVSLVAVLRGLAARRRAEQGLAEMSALQRGILDGADHAIVAGDASGITLFNRGAERLLGYSADELVGRRDASIFHLPEEVAERAAELSAELGRTIEPGFEVFLARARGGDVDRREWTYVRKDGSRVPVELAVTALRDAAGGVVSFLGIAQDISARRQAAAAAAEARDALAAAKDRAEAADRVKSAFLATMSHELRTPLNSILGFTGILLQELPGPLNPEQAKQLGMVQGSARHLLALINDVLDLSKIEAGELRVAREPFDLRGAVERAVGAVRPLAEKKGLALRAELERLPREAVGDARRVEQVLLNLLGNALKFTERGEVELSAEPVADFRSRASGPELSAVRIRIRDTGPGMLPEELATLFQPFRQLDSGLARSHEGTGLGLAICRRLAALMGGDVAAESEWRRGSTFTFTLPLAGATSP